MRIYVVHNVDAQPLARHLRQNQVGAARWTLLMHGRYSIGMMFERNRVFKHAVRDIPEMLVNMSRLFFPSEVVVSGPFIENADVWKALTGALGRRDLLVGLPMPPLARQRVGHQLDMQGASMPLLLHGLKQLVAQSLL